MSKHINSKASHIRTYLRANPKAKTDQVIAALKEQGIADVKRTHVYSLRGYDRLRAKRLRNKRTEAKAEQPKPVDNINHPAHYTAGGIETIDFIKAKLTPEEYKGYLKGNVLKYASRAGLKGNAVEDAGKLAWYANRLASDT